MMKGCSLNYCETPCCRIAKRVLFRINYQAPKRHLKLKPLGRPFRVGIVRDLHMDRSL